MTMNTPCRSVSQDLLGSSNTQSAPPQSPHCYPSYRFDPHRVAATPQRIPRRPFPSTHRTCDRSAASRCNLHLETLYTPPLKTIAVADPSSELPPARC